jgi:type IV fimbrial biogenesis protein FimT
MKTAEGFTLIDLLISLSIFAILGLYAVPELNSQYHKSQLRSSFAHIERSLAFARQQALTIEEEVTICFTNSDNRCIKNATRNSELSVYIDLNRNARIEPDERIIYSSRINQNGFLSVKAALGRPYFRYKKDGSSEVAGSFIYCNARYPTHSGRITVSMAGRAYKARLRGENGIIKLTSGKEISC